MPAPPPEPAVPPAAPAIPGVVGGELESHAEIANAQAAATINRRA
jgi:hypothetical protein